MSKIDSRTRSAVGRVVVPAGATSRRPRLAGDHTHGAHPVSVAA